MRAGSLCTGIGGLDLAAEAFFGAELAWFAEWENAPASVIEREWPGVPNLRDLTAVDWADVEPVDVLTAGYPCQPFSHAGKRQGAKDERHLWPYIAEAVRVLRPRWVVLENVAGHLSLGFGDVLRDLAEAGFDAEWCVLRASDVGACHQRARLFIVARDADRSGVEGRSAIRGSGQRAPRSAGVGPAADADREPARGHSGAASRPQEPDGGRGAAHLGHGPSDGAVPAADARGERHGRGQDAGSVGRVDRGDEGPARQRQRSRPLSGDRSAAPPPDAASERRAGRVESREDVERDGFQPALVGAGADTWHPDPPVQWGQYEPAIRRWELTLGRPAPRPVDDAGRLAPAFVEWMMGYPEGWVAGLSRTQALKALGNAVVPQQGFAALCELVPALLEREVAA